MLFEMVPRRGKTRPLFRGLVLPPPGPRRRGPGSDPRPAHRRRRAQDRLYPGHHGPGDVDGGLPRHGLPGSQGVFQVWLGGNLFNRKGVWLDLRAPGLTLRGEVRYGPFTPLKSDIMGPFRFLPAMECSHGVLSMGHRLEGGLTLNGRELVFDGGHGLCRDRPGPLLPPVLPVDPVRLAGQAQQQPDAVHRGHPRARRTLHRLHLRGALRRAGIPPGHLPGGEGPPLVGDGRRSSRGSTGWTWSCWRGRDRPCGPRWRGG